MLFAVTHRRSEGETKNTTFRAQSLICMLCCFPSANHRMSMMANFRAKHSPAVIAVRDAQAAATTSWKGMDPMLLQVMPMPFQQSHTLMPGGVGVAVPSFSSSSSSSSSVDAANMFAFQQHQMLSASMNPHVYQQLAWQQQMMMLHTGGGITTDQGKGKAKTKIKGGKIKVEPPIDFGHFTMGLVEPPRKPGRHIKSPQQLRILKQFFANNIRPTKSDVKGLVAETGLPHNEVTRWFRNERHKEKKSQEQKNEGKSEAIQRLANHQHQAHASLLPLPLPLPLPPSKPAKPAKPAKVTKVKRKKPSSSDEEEEEEDQEDEDEEEDEDNEDDEYEDDEDEEESFEQRKKPKLCQSPPPQPPPPAPNTQQVQALFKTLFAQVGDENVGVLESLMQERKRSISIHSSSSSCASPHHPPPPPPTYAKILAAAQAATSVASGHHHHHHNHGPSPEAIMNQLVQRKISQAAHERDINHMTDDKLKLPALPQATQ
jgi:hypothetical protein